MQLCRRVFEFQPQVKHSHGCLYLNILGFFRKKMKEKRWITTNNKGRRNLTLGPVMSEIF